MTPSSGLQQTATSAARAHEHLFNSDLLITQTDIQYANSQFPEIIHVLDYPRLKEKFAVYEQEANNARDRVRVLGFTAIVSGLAALVAVATKPVWPHAAWTRWIALLVELVGMFATLIAVGGLWLCPAWPIGKA